MAFWLIVLVLLIIAAALLLVPVLRQPQRDLPEDRDRLNTRFYHQRLQELEQDEEQGVVAERQVMIEELQQNLLSDVPDAQAAKPEPLNRWVLLPGVVILVLISVGFYLKTGGLAQVLL